MKHRRFFCALVSLAALLAANAPVLAYPPSSDVVPIDPDIAAMAAAVSPAQLRTFDSGLLAFGTRNAFSDRLRNSNRGVFAARNWLRAQFEQIAATANGRLRVSFDTYIQPKTDRTPRAVQISSVIATLKGDDPTGRTYLLSSHYDSRNSNGNDALKDAPGADDNGSGVSCVLEAARVMAPHRFRATIIFAAYDGEEQGLFGSGHHAKVLHDSGARIDGNLNNDIIGSSTGHNGEQAPNDVRLFSEALPRGASAQRINLVGGENDSPARELARFVKTVSEAYVPPMHADLIFRSDRFLRGGDQQSFSAQGFAAVRFVEAHENYDHQHQDVRVANGIQYGDLQQYMDFDYLARVTRMNVAALATLSLGPAAPQRVEMVNRQLGYDTTLRWSAVPGAASYEVVWRDTAAPLWEHVQDVGNVTTATVNASKDENVFGVRAVDAQGHRTPAVFPVPVKE
jgi:Zn-dependent M28 family amino/carboxypeptidase